MSDLVAVPTLEEVVEEWKQYLPERFPLSNDDAFSTFFTYQKLSAQGIVDTRAFIRDLYPQGFGSTATGSWLDLHAADHGFERIPSRHTEGLVDFIVSEPLSVPAGSVVQTPTDPTGNRYRFVVAETTPCQPPLTRVPVRAESPGAAYNVGAARITTLVTQLDGVDGVRNFAPWIKVQGVDRESDEGLRRRLLLVWPELGSGSTYHAYESWARDVQGVVKVSVLDQHPRGQGTVDVVIAPSLGQPSKNLIDEVQAVVTARRPITSDALVRGPAVRPLNLDLTVYLRGPDLDGRPLWVSRARAVMEALDISQTFFPSTVSEVLHDFPNVKGVGIGSPLQPVVVPPGTLIVPATVTVTVVPS